MNLSVLIPMYNSEKYITRCLESIIRQNIPEEDYEIIIIDDDSTDNSRNLVEPYTKRYNNIFLHCETNAGTYTTRNKLIKLARGKYIYNIDADDYLAGDFLISFLDIALKHELDILAFDSLETEESKNFHTDDSIDDLKTPDIIDGQQFILKKPDHRDEIWWYLIRSDFLRTHKFFFEKNEYNADVVFTIKLFLAAQKVIFFPIKIHRYFQSNDSLMRNNDLVKIKKLNHYLLQMILDLNNLIVKLQKDKIMNPAILDHLKKKRDGFIRVLIVKLIAKKNRSGEIDTMLLKLREHNIYPIENPDLPDDNIVRQKLINFIVNKKFLIHLVSKLYNVQYYLGSS